MICSRKICIHRGKDQNISNFHKDRTKKTGYMSCCKDCKRGNVLSQPYLDESLLPPLTEKICSDIRCVHKGKLQPIANFRKKSELKSGYASQCKNCADLYTSDYHKRNPEYRKRQVQQWELSFAKYSVFDHQINKYEETREDPINKDQIQVKCAYTNCQKWFNPTVRSISNRLRAINGKIGGENRLYCGEECKNICPIYKTVKYRKDERKRNYKSTSNYRPVQSQLRQLVFERDNFICQVCEIRPAEVCHHFDSVSHNPIESADIDNCISLCKSCEKRAHSQIGCRDRDLSCKS